MGNWVLLGELAKMSKVSDSTARRYANIFSDYMQSKSFGRITKYQPESAAIFSRVSELYQEGRNTVEILDILPHEFPRLDGVKPEEPEVTWDRPTVLPDAGVMAEVKEAFAAQSEILQKLADILELRGQEANQIDEAQRERSRGISDQLALLSKDINTHIVTQKENNQGIIHRLDRQGAELEKHISAQEEKTQRLLERLEQQAKEINELKALVKAMENPAEARKEQYIESITKTAAEKVKEPKPVSGQRTEFNGKTGAITTEGSRFKLEERIVPKESRLSKEGLSPEGLTSALAGYPSRNDPAQTENERLALYLKDRKNPSEPKEPVAGWKFWENWKGKGKRRRR